MRRARRSSSRFCLSVSSCFASLSSSSLAFCISAIALSWFWRACGLFFWPICCWALFISLFAFIVFWEAFFIASEDFGSLANFWEASCIFWASSFAFFSRSSCFAWSSFSFFSLSCFASLSFSFSSSSLAFWSCSIACCCWSPAWLGLAWDSDCWLSPICVEAFCICFPASWRASFAAWLSFFSCSSEASFGTFFAAASFIWFPRSLARSCSAFWSPASFSNSFASFWASWFESFSSSDFASLSAFSASFCFSSAFVPFCCARAFCASCMLWEAFPVSAPPFSRASFIERLGLFAPCFFIPSASFPAWSAAACCSLDILSKSPAFEAWDCSEAFPRAALAFSIASIALSCSLLAMFAVSFARSLSASCICFRASAICCAASLACSLPAWPLGMSASFSAIASACFASSPWFPASTSMRRAEFVSAASLVFAARSFCCSVSFSICSSASLLPSSIARWSPVFSSACSCFAIRPLRSFRNWPRSFTSCDCAPWVDFSTPSWSFIRSLSAARASSIFFPSSSGVSFCAASESFCWSDIIWSSSFLNSATASFRSLLKSFISWRDFLCSSESFLTSLSAARMSSSFLFISSVSLRSSRNARSATMSASISSALSIARPSLLVSRNSISSLTSCSTRSFFTFSNALRSFSA